MRYATCSQALKEAACHTSQPMHVQGQEALNALKAQPVQLCLEHAYTNAVRSEQACDIYKGLLIYATEKSSICTICALQSSCSVVAAALLTFCCSAGALSWRIMDWWPLRQTLDASRAMQ